ncbi:MAG: VWA domain-containing protein [Pyrinomonadaceae bacterium]
MRFAFICLAFCLTVLVSSVAAQQPTVSPTSDKKTDDEILRINTNLIQTGFYVVDKSGVFVKGLTKEDIELKIDGKLVPTLFFDQVTTAATTSKSTDRSGTLETTVGTSDVRRTLVFVVDDLHLKAADLILTRKMILKFIDEQMLANDRVAIVSSGGKIGFLQQFTSDKAVLRAAAGRLTYSAMSSDDMRKPKMDEFAAQMIERGDRTVTDYFVGQTAAVERLPRMMAESFVQTRARGILARTRIITSSTLNALESTIRQSAVFPGRKAIFFISDGFLLDPGNTDSAKRLDAISDIATRSNSVIYSFDAKGLEADMPEDGSQMGFQLQAGSRFEMQDGLAYVAYNTGGKFIHNTNGILEKVTESAAEAFTYYLLAWEPEIENAATEKLKRIEVTVKGRPELKVRIQNGYLAAQANAAKEAKPETKTTTTNLPKKEEKTNVSPLPPNQITTALAVRYLDLPEKGPTLSSTIQIGVDALAVSEIDGKPSANVEIEGQVLDSNGKQVNDFKLPVTIALPKSGSMAGLRFNYDHEMAIKPGLYQLRISTRDVANGKKGSSSQWIEVPDLASKRLAISSLIIGERKNDSKTKNAAETALERKVDYRFERTSSMRFMGFIYNASGGKPEFDPDLTIRVEILKQGKVVGTMTPNLVELEPRDNARIPFAGEMFLDTFMPWKLRVEIDGQRQANEQRGGSDTPV